MAEPDPSGGDDGWRVETQGEAINGPGGEWNVWVSEDESLMIFEASGRETNVTASGDLYAVAWAPILERVRAAVRTARTRSID